MPDLITWDDADEIAQILRQRFPDTDPEILAEVEIARWTREIPTLVGNLAPGAAGVAQIEAIRAAWHQA
ncbi:MAG: Fe-S cluster assembly protein IscX [Terriglobales bacterium]